MSDDLISRKELLEELKSFRCTLTGLRNAKGIIARAADEYKKSILKIIEEQPAAVKAENRWIQITERYPRQGEYMGIGYKRIPYFKLLNIAYITTKVEYAIGYYDGYKWTDDRHRILQNVAAWKPHEIYHPEK